MSMRLVALPSTRAASGSMNGEVALELLRASFYLLTVNAAWRRVHVMVRQGVRKELAHAHRHLHIRGGTTRRRARVPQYPAPSHRARDRRRVAVDQHSARVELGALATPQRPHDVVPRAVRERKRARRIGIVAVARKLVIALWRYVTTGVIPAGAILKVA